MRDADGIDRSFPQTNRPLVREPVTDFVETGQRMIVGAAYDEARSFIQGDGVHEHASRRWLGLRDPADLTIGYAAEAHVTIVAHRRQIAVCRNGCLVEARIAFDFLVIADFLEAFAVRR